MCDTLDFRSDPGTPLRGEIAAGRLGPVSVGRVETPTPHSVYRTPVQSGPLRRARLDAVLAWTVLAWTVLAWTVLAWTVLAWTVLAWTRCSPGARASRGARTAW